MPKHQANHPQPATFLPTHNEWIAPGIIATVAQDGTVLAVHTFGLAGDYGREMRENRFFND